MEDERKKKAPSKRRPGNGGTVLPDSPGRPKGVPNKATKRAREAIASFVDGNADRLTTWLDAIAEDNPKDAFNAFMSVVEYHIPKLQRTESDVNQRFVDKDGNDLKLEDQLILQRLGILKEREHESK